MIPVWFPTVITIGVAVMALAMLLQFGILLGMYLAIRKLQDRFEDLMDRQVQPLLSSARSIVDDSRKRFEELSSAVSAQIGKVDRVISEATDRARLQVIRADELMADTMGRVERSMEYIEKSIVRPVREVQAVAHGIGTAVEHLRRRGRHDGPERVTQDEELFI